MSEPDRAAYLEQVLVGGVEEVTIRVVDYDADWPRRFTVIQRALVEVLGSQAYSVEHIGSTAVPGLAAKPIIDVLVTVDAVEDEGYVPLLTPLGYEVRVREPGHRMLRTRARDVHLHLYAPDSPEVSAYLDLRDWLRVDPADRSRYAARKRELAQHTWVDMNAYADAKTDVVTAILTRARAWRGGQMVGPGVSPVE